MKLVNFVDIMKEEAGTHFDPAIIDALLDSREKLVTIIEKYSEYPYVVSHYKERLNQL